MQSLTAAAVFIRAYASRVDSLRGAVDLMQRQLAYSLRDDGVPYNAVFGRAKTVESVRGKLLKKKYKNPSRDMTDQLGLRVVLAHAKDVDHAVSSISKRFSVLRTKSVDKRTALALREFGYRSVHLVCELPKAVVSGANLVSGAPRVCEIQVRSLLEHCWAEIEHGVVYKAGADLPKELKRQFASLAGALEVVEGGFDRLLEETGRLVDIERAAMLSPGFSSRPLDVPRLVALLEAYYPNGRSLRHAEGGVASIPRSLVSRFVDAMTLCGVASTLDLANAICDVKFRKCVRRFASAEVVGPNEVSHSAMCLLLIGQSLHPLLDVYFAEEADSASLRYALAGG